MFKYQHPSNSSLYSGEHEHLDTGLFPKQKNCCESDLFEELNHFRNKVEEGRSGLHHYPYTVNKGKVAIYQLIFIILSAVFFGAAAYLYFSHLNWVYFTLLGSCTNLKIFFYFLCAILGASTAFMGMTIRPEKEVADFCFKRAFKKIKKIYDRKVSSSHCAHYSSPRGMCTIRRGNKSVYEDLRATIISMREEVQLTLKRIHVSKTMDDEQKEMLYNQTILELQFNLERMVDAYRYNRLLPLGSERSAPSPA